MTTDAHSEGLDKPRQPDPMRKLAPGEPRYHSLWKPKPDGAYFDEATAQAAVDFFPRYCRLTADPWAGQPFTLAAWQADWIIRPAFGWKRKDGTRLYRRVIIWMPRKNGKTELMAGVSHLCLLGDAVKGAELYSIAASGNQAEIVFNAAKMMVAYSEDLAEQYEVFEGSLFARATLSKFEPLTGKPHGKHGLKTCYLIGDEVHEWTSDRLYTFVRQAMASRTEPMEWLISSAGVEDGYGISLWDESLGICEDTFDDPETLVLIWCAPQDPKVEVDITDPAVQAEANPGMPVSPRPDYMHKASREAKQSPRKENDFKCYHLGIWVNSAERWFQMSKWNANALPSRDPAIPRWQELEEELAGRECWGGLDLANTQDFNALTWWFPPLTPEERWKVLCRFWYPRVPMLATAEKSRVPLLSWEKLGAFTATPGEAADHDWIMEQVHADCSTFKVLGLGIDIFNAHSVLTKLHNDGVPVESVRFGMLSMSGPAKDLERTVLKERIDHGGHPVLKWMAGNTAIRRDKNGNYMPCKESSAGKIDGIAALNIAVALGGAESPPESYLTSSPILFVGGRDQRQQASARQ